MNPASAGATAKATAPAKCRVSAPANHASVAEITTPASQSQHASASSARGAAFAGFVTADFVDTERRPASKRLLNALRETMPASSRYRKRTQPVGTFRE